MTSETIISIFLGIGLAASVGFRVFLPLFALSFASYFNIWQLNENWEWIGGITALIILGVATIVEIFAYYIPYVDNLLDSIAVPLATIAGTAVMVSTVADLSPEITWALAIIAGGGTAAAISGASGATRLASTASTAGVGNPIVSTVETGTSVMMTIASIFVPILGFVLVLIVVYIIFKIYKKIKSTKT
jgi:Kef-type K+ transport system membrane component KefB